MPELLLVHTGGTIGMAPTASGLAPKEGLLEDALKSRLPKNVTLKQRIFDPLIDSSNINYTHWNEILDAIDAAPNAVVIVTHGTDTMAYTGAALAQALAGLNRSVVLCGSMVPLGMGGDAEENLGLAVSLALDATSGTFLAFAGMSLPAESLIKHDSQNTGSFRSLPSAPLAPPINRRFAPKQLAVLTATPNMSPNFLEAALSSLDGVVLRLYGAGTFQHSPVLLDVLKNAVESGTRIRAVSQCETGGLAPGTYAAGAALWDIGVENGGLDTPEAALVQLWLNS